ncbi:MAG TPA: hypothetical protein VFP58_07030 [Candidatus Eisenbacteria bacterium]|nr:hypothetical protein [Candidatus Eisenbacteria bacterium]
MRPDRFALVLLAAAFLSTAAAVGAQPGAPGDTTRAEPTSPAARADTARAAMPADTVRAPAADDTTGLGAGADTLRGAVAVADTTRAVRRAPPVPLPSEAISLDDERTRGALSLAQTLRALRPVLSRPLPLVGPEVGPTSVPDAGSRFRTAPPGWKPLSATDRPMVTAPVYGIGPVDLGTTIDASRAEEEEIFDFISLGAELEPESYGRAGELLAQPGAVLSFERVMPGSPDRLRTPRSALYYGNGRSGELDAGARFLSSSLGWGIGASHTRHEADGTDPLHRSRTSRYALASGLPRALGHHLWFDGVVFDWTIEDQVPGVDDLSNPILFTSRSEFQDRIVRLHGRTSAGSWSSGWTAGAADIRRTEVDDADPLGDQRHHRERWKLPETFLEWTGRAGTDSSTWSARAEASARTRRIEYRVGDTPEIDVQRKEARLSLGIARALRRGAGLEAAVAGDWREAAPALVDGRLSFWTGNSRTRLRIDAERAYERPTWIDLLTPIAVIDSGIPNRANRIRITRGGDPSLPARSLTGLLGRVSHDFSRRVSATLEGSARRVEDDFGWSLTSTRTPILSGGDTLHVDTRAVSRGDGWVSYGGASLRAHAGAFRLEGAGWIRGGSEGLSPQAGSPPRFAADVAGETRVVLFQGDLPLIARVEAHGEGPRTGDSPEPGWVTVDAMLRADFGAAAVLTEFTNVFDRVVPSGVTDLSTGRAIPMPGFSIRLGIMWYLLD